VHEFIDLGFKAIILCTKAELLGQEFVGRILDHDLIKDLPANVDPCGENGEFHTFCFDGPLFQQPVAFTIGEKVFREYKTPKEERDNCFNTQQDPSMGFWFCDLLPQ
jgi:diphthamide synthase (EF-2-diphthine--ammonia ligase)